MNYSQNFAIDEQPSLAINPALMTLVDERDRQGYKPGWLLYRAFDLELNDDDFRFLAGEFSWQLDWLRISYSQARLKRPHRQADPEPVQPDGSEHGQLWAAALNHIARPGTRALLRAQCSLADFDGQAALIFVRARALEKMIESKISDLEHGFEVVCDRPIEILLEVSAS